MAKAGQGITLWHNPRCGRSRAALEILERHGIEPTIRLYLKQPPSRSELTDLVRRSGLPAADLVRWKDPPARENTTIRDDDDAVLDLLLANPALLERPILTDGSRAILGRKEDQVLAFLGIDE